VRSAVRQAYGGAVREQLESLWARVWVCLIVSPLAFLGGGALLFAAVHEIVGDYDESCTVAGATCHDPRGWVVLGCSVAGFACFAAGAAAWFRAVQLFARAKARRAVTS
jgi:hypothetical protein